MTSNNVRYLRLHRPTVATEAELEKHRGHDPLLYGIITMCVFFAGLIGLGIYYAIRDVQQNPWDCPNDGSQMAGYFERCVKKWRLQNRPECLEDARILFCHRRQ